MTNQRFPIPPLPWNIWPTVDRHGLEQARRPGDVVDEGACPARAQGVPEGVRRFYGSVDEQVLRRGPPCVGWGAVHRTEPAPVRCGSRSSGP